MIFVKSNLHIMWHRKAVDCRCVLICLCSMCVQDTSDGDDGRQTNNEAGPQDWHHPFQSFSILVALSLDWELLEIDVHCCVTSDHSDHQTSVYLAVLQHLLYKEAKALRLPLEMRDCIEKYRCRIHKL